MNPVHTADARRLSHILDAVIDFILTSPPYNLKQLYADGITDYVSAQQYLEFVHQSLVSMARVLKPTGILALSVAPTKFLDLPTIWKAEARKLGFHHHHTFAWHKPDVHIRLKQTEASIDGYHTLQEQILIFGRTKAALCTIPSLQSDPLFVAPMPLQLHPAPMPIALARAILLALNLPTSACIYDPFCGSGTTLIAARQLGYKAYGSDLSQTYQRLATIRLMVEAPEHHSPPLHPSVRSPFRTPTTHTKPAAIKSSHNDARFLKPVDLAPYFGIKANSGQLYRYFHSLPGQLRGAKNSLFFKRDQIENLFHQMGLVPQPVQPPRATVPSFDFLTPNDIASRLQEPLTGFLRRRIVRDVPGMVKIGQRCFWPAKTAEAWIHQRLNRQRRPSRVPCAV